MQFESALFILVFVGMACAVIAAVSSLFRPRDLKPHEKLVISSRKRLKKAKAARIGQSAHQCRIIWRRGNEVGVEFVTAKRADSAAVADEPSFLPWLPYCKSEASGGYLNRFFRGVPQHIATTPHGFDVVFATRGVS
jgi:hypothetical protein